jgi:hypothetical protein
VHCNGSGQSTESSIAAIRPQTRGSVRTIREEGQPRHWRRRRSRQREKLHTRAAEVPRGARGAGLRCAGRAIPRNAHGPERAPEVVAGRLRRHRRPAWQPALIQCGAQKPRSLPSVRTGQPCRSPYRVGTRRVKRISVPKGGRIRAIYRPPLERKTTHLRSTRPDPGAQTRRSQWR